MFFEIKDWFKDPGDIFDTIDGDNELLGGKPYPIAAQWRREFHWEGIF